jgi:hypothetical protein
VYWSLIKSLFAPRHKPRPPAPRLFLEQLETRLVPSRLLYAVSQSPDVGVGTISVYDIDNGHQLVQTYPTGVDAADIRGVCASAATGMLYFSYINGAGQGRVCAFSLTSNSVTGDFGVATPSVDRLSISPDGLTLYVPGYEYDQDVSTINVVDLNTGAHDRTDPGVRRAHAPARGNDLQLRGPARGGLLRRRRHGHPGRRSVRHRPPAGPAR